MLLYLVTKNHSFSDESKRIAPTLFLWSLNGNGILYNDVGSKRIADNTLVALTLMIAESRTEEKTQWPKSSSTSSTRTTKYLYSFLRNDWYTIAN